MAACITKLDEEVSEKKLRRDLRLTYHFSDFQTTQLYENVKNWAAKRSIQFFK